MLLTLVASVAVKNMKEEKAVAFSENSSCSGKILFMEAPSSSSKIPVFDLHHQNHNDYGFWDNGELEDDDDELTKKVASLIYAVTASGKGWGLAAMEGSSCATSAMSSAFHSAVPSATPSRQPTPEVSRTDSPKPLSSGKTQQSPSRPESVAIATAAGGGPSSSSSRDHCRGGRGSLPEVPTTSPVESSSPVDDRFISSPNSKVVYLLEKRSPVATRSFGQLAKQVCVSMGGIRIVQDKQGEHAEFKVHVTVGDQIDISSWKTFSEFEELAEALKEVSHGADDGGFGFSISSCFPSSLCPTAVTMSSNRGMLERLESRQCISLRNALLAWDDVVASRSWAWLNKLSVQQLVQEARELEKFLQEVLFEIPTAEVLIVFARNNMTS